MSRAFKLQQPAPPWPPKLCCGSALLAVRQVQGDCMRGASPGVHTHQAARPLVHLRQTKEEENEVALGMG